MAKKSMPWFRLYTEMPSDRKIRRLKVEHRWLWVCVLCAARQSPIHGLLLVADGVPCDEQDLADMSGLSPRQVAAGLAALATIFELSLACTVTAPPLLRMADGRDEGAVSAPTSSKLQW